MFFFACNTAVFCFTLNFIKGYGQRQAPDTRMFHGSDASIYDFPYYASVGPCGAAILNENWLLTTAHCLPAQLIPGENYVWVGGEYFNTSRKIKYDRLYIHPDADFRDNRIPFNDIGLIYIGTDMEFSNRVRKVTLPSRDSGDPNYICVGRGIDETGSIGHRLKKMQVVRLSMEDCLKDLPPEYWHVVRPHVKFLEKNNICATRIVDSAGLCYGDSGSPLVQDNVLRGLASYIGNTCEDSRMGFYVNVSTYMPWIWNVAGLYK